MEALFFIIFLGMIAYGFIMSHQGRDIIATAVGRRADEDMPAPRINPRRNLPPKETIPNRRETFGLRQR